MSDKVNKLLDLIAKVFTLETGPYNNDPAISLAKILASISATDAHPGIVEAATIAEVKVGTDIARFITPELLRTHLTQIKVLSFVGRIGAGAITLTGAAVDDIVIGVASVTAAAIGGAAASFEATITVADQIQQSSAANLSANSYVVILLTTV